jgi:hypothetical protein
MTPRTRRYLSTQVLTERPRVVPVSENSLNWGELRRWGLSLGFLLIAVAASLVESSVAMTSELQIAQLAKVRDLVRNQNLQLAGEIAEYDKPQYIRSRAFALGLVEIGKTIALPVPEAAPDAPLALPSPALAQGWLEQRFGEWMRTIVQTAP